MALPVIGNPASYDLQLLQGDTFSRSCSLTVAGVAQDLTGCTIVAKIRASFNAAAALIVALSVDTTLLPSGQFVLSLTKAQTLALAIPGTVPDPTRGFLLGYWDAHITDPTATFTYRYGQGSVFLNRQTSF